MILDFERDQLRMSYSLYSNSYQTSFLFPKTQKTSVVVFILSDAELVSVDIFWECSPE